MFRFSDGCDSYAATSDLSKKWTTVPVGWTYQAIGGIAGGAISSTVAAGTTLWKVYRSSALADTRTNVSFWVKIASAPAADQVMLYLLSDYGGQYVGGIGIQGTTGLLASTLFYSVDTLTAVNICDNTWHHIELTVFRPYATAVHATMTVRVDGTAVLTNVSTGVDFDYITGTNTVVFMTIGGSITIDDVIIWDDEGTGMTTFPLGLRMIQTLRPSGAGSSTQWSPVAVSLNYDAVDDVGSDGDAGYVASSAPGQKDLYAFSNLASPITSVTAAVVSTMMKNGLSGDRVLHTRVKSSSSAVNGSSYRPSAASYVLRQEAFVTDPATSAAWTGSGINAAEFGVELVS